MEKLLCLSVYRVLGLYLIIWMTDISALKDVQLIAPTAVRLGDSVVLGCKWALEHNETLYSVKWYRGRQEFFSYLPKEYPFTRVFEQPGLDIDVNKTILPVLQGLVSRSSSHEVVITRASRGMAGRYRCEVSADAPSFHTQVRSAYIHVVELPPDRPIIKAEKGWYASGDSLRAQCSSPPADPPANLTWLLNGRDEYGDPWERPMSSSGRRKAEKKEEEDRSMDLPEHWFWRFGLTLAILAGRLEVIQGKPVIQQRILPSPVVSIDVPHQHRQEPGDETNNIIFSPWKAFGPYVDTIQDGDILPSQDAVVLPTPRHHHNTEDDATDPSPTAEASNKVASVSQLSFMVRPDSFERGQLRLTCISSVHSVYNERAELVINEERPQIASVLGTRDSASGTPLPPAVLILLSVSVSIFHILKEMQR